MSKQPKARPVRVSLTACEPCRVTFDPTPGGASCPHCGARGVTALVVLARDGATVEAAAELLLDTLGRMAALRVR